MIVFILLVILYFSFYRYLENLRKENCECALNKDYDLIKKITLIYFIYILVLPIFITIILLTNKKLILQINNYKRILMLIGTIILITFMYLVYRYIQELKDKNCDCSKSNVRWIMYYYSIFVMFVDSIILLILLSSYFTNNKTIKDLSNVILDKPLSKNNKNNKNNKNKLLQKLDNVEMKLNKISKKKKVNKK